MLSLGIGVGMKIQTIIANKQAHFISASDTVAHLVERLNGLRIGAMVVSNDGKAIEGIVSERDVVRAMPGKFDLLGSLHVRDIMTVNVHTCTPDSTVAEIMAMMTRERIRHVPVVDSVNKLISIISIGDVVKHHLDELSSENQALKEYLTTAN
jgi:CBS domain-containing protein